MPLGATPPGSVVPPVPSECPAFRAGTINYMGLGGIDVVTGPKAASPTAPMVFYWHGTEFFKAHPFGVSPESWAGGLPPGFSPQCKVF